MRQRFTASRMQIGELVDAAGPVGEDAADGDVAGVVVAHVGDLIEGAGQEVRGVLPGQAALLGVPEVVGPEELVHPAEGHGVPAFPAQRRWWASQVSCRASRKVSGGRAETARQAPRHGFQAAPGSSGAGRRRPGLSAASAYWAADGPEGVPWKFPRRRRKSELFGGVGAACGATSLERAICGPSVPADAVPEEAGVIRGEVVGVGEEGAGGRSSGESPGHHRSWAGDTGTETAAPEGAEQSRSWG